MTESSAAAAVETTPVSLTLPVLHPSQRPREVVKHLQHMFNDFAAANGDPPLFNETGEYGPKTTRAVEEFQRDHGLQDTGSVGSGTWRELLEAWLPRR
jgi:murein L,D-transpeptidase YcbB/YkuD